MNKIIPFLLLLLSLVSCRHKKTRLPVYMVPAKPVLSFEDGFYFDDGCIGDRYFFDNCLIFFSNIELNAPVEFVEEAVLFFNEKEINFKECFGLISRYDIPELSAEKTIDIHLSVADFDYRCEVPSSAFQDIEYLVFNLNFKDSKKCCNESYFGRASGETSCEISGAYTPLDKERKQCDPAYAQTMEMIQAKGEGENPKSRFSSNHVSQGKYKDFTGKYKSVLNERDFISFELKDSSKITLSIYNEQELLREEKGTWIYSEDQNSIGINFESEIKMIQNQDTLNLKYYALLVKEEDASNLALTTYRITEDKIKAFELLNLKKEY